MTRDGRPVAASRRGVLSSLAGLTAFSGIATSGIVDPVPDTDTDAVDLGDFESGRDGWRPVGELELSRVDRGAWAPTPTASGRSLRAAADGAIAPAIARSVDAVELLATPYVTATVVPGAVSGVEAPVAFEFRLVRDGVGRGGRAILDRSDPVAVRQAVAGHVYWDVSDVDAAAARLATDLELAWSPAAGDRDADGESADVPYRGAVVLDAVGASADPDAVAAIRFVRIIRRLEAEHGSLQRTAVDERRATASNGRFVFADGTTVAYSFEERADDGYRLTVAGETVAFGGDR